MARRPVGTEAFRGHGDPGTEALRREGLSRTEARSKVVRHGALLRAQRPEAQRPSGTETCQGHKESMRRAGFAKRRSNEDSEAVDGELPGCFFTNDGTQHFVEGGGEPCGFERRAV